MLLRIALLVALLGLVAACAGGEREESETTAGSLGEPDLVTSATEAVGVRSAATPADPTREARLAAPRPSWLGMRVLPLRPDGLGEIVATPPELVDRRLATPWHLPPPGDETYSWHAEPVSAEVIARSTWSPECPVGITDLRYLTVTFWGFDGGHHTGELIVHRDVVGDVVEVFGRLHDARFPIEEMRVIAPDELDAPPTGDGNVSSAFVCRQTVSGGAWSEHAYGRAVDVNPFHNPYVRGDVVIPELASAYTDRSWTRPGMIRAGDVVTAAFADVGWSWGGDWTSATDPMHFSTTGR